MLDAIMLVGDSLTQGGWDAGGFAQRLAYVYARRLDVVNRGLSGYNTEWGMPVFEKEFPKKGSQGPKIKLLTLWWGANDSCLEPSPQYVSLERFEENIKTYVSMVQSPKSEWYSPDTKIVLITPPPIDEHARGADLASRDPPLALDRSTANTIKYVDVVKRLGGELGLPVVDLYEGIWSAADGGQPDKFPKYLSDGLHLTTAGYTILYDALVSTIKTNLPDLYHENIPFVYPKWQDVNWKNARESIN